MAKHRRKITKGQLVGWMIAILLLMLGAVVLLVAGISSLIPKEPSPADVSTTATTATTTTAAATTTATPSTTQNPTASITEVIPTGNHYLQPAGAVWYLKLANDWNTLPADYDASFTAVEYGGGLTGKLFDSRAVEALREMLAAGNKADASLRLQPVSCYRSVALQKSLYDRQVQKQLANGYARAKAEEIAATIVKRPGQSEHNTGLAADLGGSGDYSLNQSFENTKAFRWLMENCADYGFILRFPKNKEAITGVIYEPWHYRYVGKEAAREIMDGGLCLEEYLEKHGL